MPHKYDIEADQLKCNFCTQWFRCTLHFANLQRYSLKACPHCLQHFNYTLLHPDTHKIFKVMLIDTNIVIPKPNEQSKERQTCFELEQIEQEIKDRISQHFEEKIKKMLEEMEESSKKVESSVRDVFCQMSSDRMEQSGLKGDRKWSKQQLQREMQKIKEKPLTHWIGGGKPPLSKNSSVSMLNSRRKMSQNANKENVSQHQGWGKAIKSKVGMANKQPQLSSMKSSLCLPYFKGSNQALREGSPSLNASFNHNKSAKRLGLSTLNTSRSVSNIEPHEERDLTQVTKLLDSTKKATNYLPYELQPENSIVKLQSRRTQADDIIDLRSKINKGGQLIQLVGKDISKVNFPCFLKSLGPQQKVKTIRVIKASMSDYEFDHLLKFIADNPTVQTLIVTNNRLTELSLVALVNFSSQHKNTSLRHVYMGSNRLSREHVTCWLPELEARGVNLFL